MTTFVTLITCVIFWSVLDITVAKPLQNYAAVIDAGSSGSRLRIYSVIWSAGKNPNLLPDVEEIFSLKVQPGLDSVSQNVSALAEYLGVLIQAAKDNIPSPVQKNTPFYLLATAGLRVLETDELESLLTSARGVLSDPNILPFKFTPEQARVLSGEEEGAFAWISVNYLRGSLDGDKSTTAPSGVLEMGGGSAQITFSPSNPVLANKFPVRVAGESYPLYAHSYLNYGQEYMLRRIQKALVDRASVDETELSNPCMLKDDIQTDTTSDGRIVNFIGSGNPSECEALLAIYLREGPESFCQPKPCTIGTTYQPPLDGQAFVAVGVYAIISKNLRAVDDGNMLNVQRLKENAAYYCQLDVSTAIEEFGILPDYTSATCLSGLYIPLMLDAYGFPVDTNDVTVLKKINGISPEWALGAVLYELGRSCNT